MTSDMWLGPEIPAMKELAEFELRYWKAIAPETAGVSAEQMAAVMAMYPMVKQGMERLNRRRSTCTARRSDGHDLRRGQEHGAGGEGQRVRAPAAAAA